MVCDGSGVVLKRSGGPWWGLGFRSFFLLLYIVVWRARRVVPPLQVGVSFFWFYA